MGVSNRQAAFGIWFMAIMTILGGFTIMASFVTFGIAGAALSSILFFLVTILVFVMFLMYSRGALELTKTEKKPEKKSKIKAKILSIKNAPFKVKKGRKSDVIISWKLRKMEYLMKIWFNEKNHSCKFKEELKKGKIVEKRTRYKGGNLEKKNKTLLIPQIWPVLTGKKDIDPREARELIWKICDEHGWKFVRI